MKRIWILTIFAIATTAAFLATSCDELITETNEIILSGFPIAEFFVDTNTCCLPCSIQFWDDSDGPHDKWSWDFGDGSSDSIADPLHGYALAGKYKVILIITDTENGNNDREIKLNFIEVKDTLDRTTALLDFFPLNPLQADTLTFTVSSFGIATSWSWNFGDDSTSNKPSPVKHPYDSAGTYEVSVRIANDCDTLDLVDTVTVN